MKKLVAIIFFFISLNQIVSAQNVTAKVIDAKTNEYIAFANITTNNDGTLVSNSEGNFTLSQINSDDKTVITISFIGYISRTINVAEIKNLQYLIKLEPAVFELNTVKISDKEINPYQIIANAKANFQKNYAATDKPIKNQIFFRKSSSFNPNILDVEIDKSSGFSKIALKEANAQVTAFTSKLIAQPPRQFVDMLCNRYRFQTKKDDKFFTNNKLEVVKATILKNENSATSLDELQEKATSILLVHLDTTKFYRVKSGLFGSRDTISFRKDYNTKKSKTADNELTKTKKDLDIFYFDNSIGNQTKFDFFHNPEIYTYVYEGATYNDQNEFVYILSFKPKKSKVKYVGKLYINESDYAIIRADYKLVEGKKFDDFNLKFLLGVKTYRNKSTGTVLYKKSAVDERYFIQYAAYETGQYAYVNRPLKFIELADGEKDVVAFDLKIEGYFTEKKEYFSINRSESNQNSIEKMTEKDFSYLKIKRYDPKIWKDFSTIEPLEEMKKFKSAD